MQLWAGELTITTTGASRRHPRVSDLVSRLCVGVRDGEGCVIGELIITTTGAFRSHPRVSGLVFRLRGGVRDGGGCVIRLPVLVPVSRAVRATATFFAEFLVICS